MKEAILDRITLANVGIDLRQTVDYHTKLLRKGADVRGRTEEAARDLRSYEAESLEDNVFAFYPYFVHDFEGRKRIFTADEPKPEFLAISQIDPRERQGAVIEGFKKVEEKIPEKGFIGWVSPDGEAGVHNISYRYHQLYLAEVDGKKAPAVALKCDVDKSILSEWLTRLSQGTVVLSDLSPRSFITSPVVLESEQNGIQSALRVLKEVLSRHNTDRFYKDVSIDKVIMSMPEERIRQEEDVKKLAQKLMPYFEKNGTDEDTMRHVIGGQLYYLYNKYRDEKGNVSLTGCGGGTKCINELFTQGKISSGILSTGFRALEIGRKARTYEFKEKGSCRTCGEEKMCGPVGICKECNDKIDSGELVV